MCRHLASQWLVVMIVYDYTTPSHLSQAMSVVDVTLRPRSIMASSVRTTKNAWDFVPYTLKSRGDQVIPEQYLKQARWCFSTYTGTERYHTLSISDHNEEDQDLYPVEFNFDHLCWVEIRWNQDRHWEAFRAAGMDLGCDIPISETRLGECCEDECQSTPQTGVQSEQGDSEPEEINVLTVNPKEEEIAEVAIPFEEDNQGGRS